MNIIDHTINWYRGEVFEAMLVADVGLALIVVGVAFFGWGKTPNAEAFSIPIIVSGVLLVATGLALSNSNRAKITEIQNSKIENHIEFAETEKKRVEDFQVLYLYTKIGAAVAFIVSLCFFFFTENRYLQSVGLALVILGLSGLTIDYFSKERADAYYEELLKI